MEHKGFSGISLQSPLVDQTSQRNQERVSALTKTVSEESDPPSTSFVPTKPGKDPATTKAYTVIKPPPATAKRTPNVPPRVVSHKELLNRTKDVQCYDAVPVNDPEDAQAQVEKFIPMLEEYLKRTFAAASPVGHTINISRFYSPIFSVRHPTNIIRRHVCERLRLGHFLPPDFKVHGLEQNLSEYRDAVRVCHRR